MKPAISIIAAMSKNRVIGKDNKLPWNIPEDLKHFHSITVGHPVIMGRKTHESIGRVLKNRTNIVITRDLIYKSPGTVISHSLKQAIDEAKKEKPSEIFIIGGAQLYEQAIAIADKLYLTLIYTHVDGDAFFPDYSRFNNIISEERHQNTEFRYSYLVLQAEN